MDKITIDTLLTLNDYDYYNDKFGDEANMHPEMVKLDTNLINEIMLAKKADQYKILTHAVLASSIYNSNRNKFSDDFYDYRHVLNLPFYPNYPYEMFAHNSRYLYKYSHKIAPNKIIYDSNLCQKKADINCVISDLKDNFLEFIQKTSKKINNLRFNFHLKEIKYIDLTESNEMVDDMGGIVYFLSEDLEVYVKIN